MSQQNILTEDFRLVKLVSFYKYQLKTHLYVKAFSSEPFLINVPRCYFTNQCQAQATTPTVKFTATHAKIKEHCVYMTTWVMCMWVPVSSKNISVYVNITLRLH